MWIVLFIAKGRNFRSKFLAIFVEFPIFTPSNIWIMRVGEGYCQTPRPIIPTSRQIIEFADGVVGNFVVIFHLIVIRTTAPLTEPILGTTNYTAVGFV